MIGLPSVSGPNTPSVAHTAADANLSSLLASQPALKYPTVPSVAILGVILNLFATFNTLPIPYPYAPAIAISENLPSSISRVISVMAIPAGNEEPADKNLPVPLVVLANLPIPCTACNPLPAHAVALTKGIYVAIVGIACPKPYKNLSTNPSGFAKFLYSGPQSCAISFR